MNRPILFLALLVVVFVPALSASASQAELTKYSFRSSTSNSIEIKGTATVKNVFVALLPIEDSGTTDWRTIYENNRYVAFTGDEITKVRKGKWKAEFSGIPSGEYRILVYDQSDTKHTLLFDGAVRITSKDPIVFKPNAKKPFTLGVGQTATDGGIDIQLVSVEYTDGLEGEVVARFFVTNKKIGTPGSYIATAGKLLTGNGGIVDSKAKTGAVHINVKELSFPRNTATLLITPVPPKG